MEDIFSIQYKAKGEKEFIVPFSVENVSEIKVFVNNILQSSKDYNVKIPISREKFSYPYNVADSVKIIFYNSVGSTLTPKIVTIEKNSLINRKTDFQDYSEFKANNLNIEFNNIINILKSFKVLLSNSVIKSKLIDNKKIIILPNIEEGKGIYWGKNGELLNTDQNVNDLLNEIAERFPDSTKTKILANRVKVDITNTTIKKENLQEFLGVLDQNTISINTVITNINKIIDQQNNAINYLTHNVNNILPDIEQLNKIVKNLQDNINEVKEKLKELGGSGSGGHSLSPIYGVVNCSKGNNRLGNYLVVSKTDPYRLDLVNINNNTPLVLSLAYKGKNILFCGDNISKFEKPFCSFLPSGAGRYYIRGEYREKTGKINLVAHKYKPYFGLEHPSKDVLIAHGCVPESSDYFVVKDMSFFGGVGLYKNKPAYYIYLGYVSLNDKGEVVSDIVLFSEQKSYEVYLDVQANRSYVLPNLIGCSCVDVSIYGLFENRVLIPVCVQGKFNKDVPHVLEMGTNYQYNLEEIFINTGVLGPMGYYKGTQMITSNNIKLKIEIKRTF